MKCHKLQNLFIYVTYHKEIHSQGSFPSSSPLQSPYQHLSTFHIYGKILQGLPVFTTKMSEHLTAKRSEAT